MAWSAITNNQMVSYLDASTSEIFLLSGQSHFTTLPAANQCMTKANMLAKYNLSASTLNAYGSLQLVPKGAWVSGVLYWPTTLTTGIGVFFDTTSIAVRGYGSGLQDDNTSALNNGNSNPELTNFGSLNGAITDPLFNNFEVIAFYLYAIVHPQFGEYDKRIILTIKGTLTPPTGWVNVTINNAGSITTLARTSATQVTSYTIDNINYVTWRWVISNSTDPFGPSVTVDVN